MKKKLLYSLLFGMFAYPGMFAADYGMPANIQDGNILHCFNWPATDVKAALPQIAAAGFGSVQLSPLQRPDARVGEGWHALYRPYDLAFKTSSFCSEQDLKDLCAEAEKYGIKIIVDVVANHVDKSAGYHDTWWDSNGRVRWEGRDMDYSNRYSVTHKQLGDYGDVNSESAEVAARGKAYVEKLKSLGVKGIRWDAAKHIALPTEGCQFWSTVTSVPGMYHYGEILDSPAEGQDGLIKEYVKYMSVTDNKYSNGAAKDNGGIPGGYGGAWAVHQGVDASKLVYWGESHDTYSNDEWSQNVDQSIIDRAYAAYACRNGSTALYLSRPNATGFDNIKVGKGSTAFTATHIAEVNKFRNTMVGKKDWCEAAGNTFTVTRQNGGAVIVMKGSGNVSVVNGGGYCPAGTYKDRVSGGTFTVTASTISGNVGSSGIAVIYADGIQPNPGPDPDPNPGPTPDPTPVDGDMWILGNLEGAAGWSTTPGTGAAMTLADGKYVAKNVKMATAAGETKCYFNLTDYVGATWDDLNMNANRYGAATEGAAITLGTPATVVKYANGVDASGCLSWTVAAGTYDFTFDPSAMTLTVVNAGDNPNPNPQPDPDPQPDPNPGTLTITGDYNLAYNGNLEKVYWWPNCPEAYPGVKMDVVKGSDGNNYKVAKLPSNVGGLLFATNGDADKTGDLEYTSEYVMDNNGATSTKVIFQSGVNPNPNPQPDPQPGDDHYIYYDGTFSAPYVWAWTSTANCTNAGGDGWPGDAMTQKDGKWYWAVPSGKPVPENIIISDKNTGEKLGANTTSEEGSGDMVYVDHATYHQDGSYTEDGPVVVKPVVTATPGSGATFTESLQVTLTVAPAADIYYTLDGSAATTSSTKYTGPITLTATTTIKTLAVTAEGAQNAQSFSYTKRNNDDPIPPVPTPGNNLITDYYKVNPNGQVGTFKTVNMTGHPATNAFSNWGPEDLIAQGVARDVCQAFKGVHERPVVDSYALYAAYDNENLYLGVQFVYTIWDLYGEGKQPGESKPYNMDGHMVIALDLDPNKSFDGYIDGTGPIWNEGAKGAKFNNGVDAVIMCSTKPGVGTPGLFLPTADGHASYNAAYCKALPSGFWGYKDGLLPSIDHVWGQDDFSYDPELLKGNTGFIDLRSEIDDSAHTFYEFKLPLSSLGITADYIRNQGIGVMYLDKYGTSPVGGTPYDPSFFDNVSGSYSQDPSSSEEKEDEDVITYSPARIGKMGTQTSVNLPVADEVAADVEPQYFTLQGVRVENPSDGIFIVVRGNKVTKEMIR